MQRSKLPNKRGTILAMDPSYSTGWGIAVLDWDGNILHLDCMRTENEAKKKKLRVGDDFVRRTNELAYWIISILDSYAVKLIVSEQPHGSQSAVAAKLLGASTAIIASLSVAKGIPVEWYLESDVKTCLFNQKNISKDQMSTYIQKIFKSQITLPTVKYYREAVSDALGVYLTACRQSTALKLMLND